MRFPFAAQPPLPLKAQPFEQRHRSAIVGVGIGIDAPKAAPGEGEIDDGGDRFARDPAAPVAAIQIGRATSELQSLMRISYAVFCLKKKKTKTTELKPPPPHTP